MKQEREIRDCTETWLHGGIPDQAVALDGQTDRWTDVPLKSAGQGEADSLFALLMLGGQIQSKLMGLMLNCQTYYVPRDFTSVFVAAVYIPTDANSVNALQECPNKLIKVT